MRDDGDNPETFVGSLDEGVVGAPTGAPAPVRAPTSRYRLGDELARGGLGIVRRAWDLQLDREVAVKGLLQASPAAELRFDREMRVTAHLQHPNIVPVHDGGRGPDGERYMAMRLVHGRSLSEVIAERPTLAERMRLLPHVIDACNALAYAHGERVVHRDVKPDNILVGDFGETVVIDWGLARDLDADPTEERAEPDSPNETRSGSFRTLTRVGSVMGTPSYMPPEQAAGQPIDQRADVYALGAVLYHTLAGVRPHKGADDPLRAVLEGPPRPLAELVPEVPDDLLAVVSKAMARDPDGRYPDARSLAAELERFQAGAFVNAHHYTWTERIRRAVRANPVAAALLVALVAGGLGAAGLLVRSARVAEAARAEAVALQQSERRRLDASTIAQARLLASTDPAGALRLLDSLSAQQPFDASVRSVAAAAVAAEPARRLLDTPSASTGAFLGWDDSGLVACLPDGSAWFGDDLEVERQLPHPPAIDCRVVGGGAVAYVLGPMVHVRTPTQERTFVVDGGVTSIHAAAGILVWSTDHGEVHVVAPTDARARVVGGFGPIQRVQVASDGRVLVLTESAVHVFDPATGRTLGSTTLPSQGYGMEASPYGSRAVVVGGFPFVLEIDWSQGHRERQIPVQGAWFAFAAWVGDDSIAVGGSERALIAVDVGSGTARTLSALPNPVSVLSARDGRVAVGTVGGEVVVVEWDTGQTTRPRVGREMVQSVAWSPDASQLAVSRRTGVELVRTSSPDGAVLVHLDQKVNGLDVAPDGRVGITSRAGAIEIGPDGARTMSSAPYASIAWCDGRWWLGTMTDLRADRLDGDAIPMPGVPSELTCSPDSRFLGVDVREVGTVFVRMRDRAVSRIVAPGGLAHGVGFDGDLLIAGGASLVELTDVDAPPVRTRDHVGGAISLVGTWRGRRVSASSDGQIQVGWEPDLRTLSPHIDLPTTLHATRAGLLVGDAIGILWRWAEPDQHGEAFVAHDQYIHSSALHPSGRWLATGGWDARIVLWDLDADDLAPRVILGHHDAVLALAWSPDGRSLIAGDRAGDVRVWSDPLAADSDALRRQVHGLVRALDAGEELPVGAALDALADP